MIDGSNKHLEIVQEIRQDHLNAARAVIQNQEILTLLESQLEKECLKLRSFLEAAEVSFVSLSLLLKVMSLVCFANEKLTQITRL